MYPHGDKFYFLLFLASISQKEGYAIDAFIPMNGEGRMSQAAALSMSLRVSERGE